MIIRINNRFIMYIGNMDLRRVDPIDFPGPGLISSPQWEQVNALAVTLSARQALWLSGYFAGLESARTGTEVTLVDPAVVSAPPAAPPAAPASAVATTRTLTILYGSETGNSAALARSAAVEAKTLGFDAAVTDMAAYKLRQLKDEQDILIVASTYGEGDPPQPASDFFEFVEGR